MHKLLNNDKALKFCKSTKNFKEIIKILDEFEGFSPTQPEKSLYLREERQVVFDAAKKPVTSFVYVLNKIKLPKEIDKNRAAEASARRCYPGDT